jgi:integrase
MPRQRKDGTKAAAPNRRKLSEIFLQRAKPKKDRAYAVWDSYQRGLCVLIQPSGHKAWKVVYGHHGRPRWYHIGDVAAIGLSDARKIAGKIMVQAADGKDPLAERRAERSRGTFQELATRYLEEYAKKNNKSWAQSDALVRRHLLKKWGHLMAADVRREDVDAMMNRIESPSVANLTLASASAIFSWGMTKSIIAVNPCSLIERKKVSARERVLSESEIPRVWKALGADEIRGAALRFLLLVGQRPGEVSAMRWEFLKDGWLEMPGSPVPEMNWKGTKNNFSHRVWIPAPAKKILDQMAGGKKPTTGHVFPGARGPFVDNLDKVMRAVSDELGIERVVPHDMRRTHGTTITRLRFGRDAMNRIQNHREGGIASIYDQHGYSDENKQIMESVAAEIVRLVEGGPAESNVVAIGGRTR